MERIGRVFFKGSRKGKVKRVLREHYLRDDLVMTPDGGWADGDIVVIDTNVALHQIDFLETTSASGELRNVVILQTVLEEVKHRSVAVFQRLKAMVQATGRHFHVFGNEAHTDTYVYKMQGESPNDRNDRAIRVAARWYHSHQDDEHKVVLVTNDRGNKALALKEGLECKTVHEYVKIKMPKNQDLLTAEGESGIWGYTKTSEGGGFRYVEHLSVEDLNNGLRSGKYKQGVLHVDRTSNLEAFVVTDGEQSGESKHRGSGTDLRDVLVTGRMNMNRAMDMDRVVVEMLPESQWQAPRGMILEADDEDDDEKEAQKSDNKPVDVSQRRPTGRVVGILRRAWRPYCGTIEMPMNARDKHVLFVPVCRQIPKIRINTTHANELADKRIVVKIDGWDATSKFPHGHFVRTIGVVGTIDTESDVILLENDVRISEFPQICYKCLPRVGPNGEWDPSPADLKGRVDFREGYRVCSIDPPGCKDIDDALHVRPLGGGRTEIGVHIADVTHFVPANNAIDEEARVRGTSVYLVQKRIDMLPSLLTTDLCSLVGNKERLAFSVVWVLDDDANILDVRFHRSVIKSVAAMSYAKAQSMIDDEADQSELAKDLRIMRGITRKLRKRREDAGAVMLASNEVRFELDSVTHDPIEATEYELKETNLMVEEMMLLANCSVAKKIHEHYPSCAMLRRHPAPPPANFEPLKKVAASLGYDLKCETNKELQTSLNLICPDEKMTNKLVRILATRCMAQAVYFASGDVASNTDYLHYGLAAPLYTHFTSPIRRYADVIVHRLLGACLGISPLPDDLKNTAGVSEIAEGINRRHRQAQFAGRQSTELHAHVYFKNRVTTEDAYVMRCRKNGVMCLVPKYGIEVPVFLPSANQPNGYTLTDDGMSLHSSAGTLKMLDKLRVEIRVETMKAHRQRLKCTLVKDGGAAASSADSTMQASPSEADGSAGAKRSGGEEGSGSGSAKKKSKKT